MTAALYSTVVPECLTAEAPQLVGNASRYLKVEHSTPCHLQLAVHRGEELDSHNKAAIADGVIPTATNLWLGRKNSIRLSKGCPSSSLSQDSEYS
jgi:hypothetical protein